MEQFLCLPDVLDKIGAAKCSAPGYDGLTYKMLKDFPLVNVETLTRHLNEMWYGKRFPIKWKTFKAFPLQKSKKDKSLVCNYRLITLIPVLCKLTNSILRQAE